MVNGIEPGTDPEKKQNRIVLGLKQPPLLSAVDWLFDNFSVKDENGTTCNLAEAVLVLPTARGQLRLRQLLAAKGKSEGIELLWPNIVTVGELPEFLYSANKPLASSLVQQLAWSRALSEMDDQDYTLLTTRSPDERPEDWQPLATLISSLHVRLSTDIWSFSSVVRSLRDERGFLRDELDRWEVLQRLQKSYYRILTDAGLWDRQAARNFAAGGLLKANEIRCHTKKTIVMLAVADLNRSVTEMLRQVRHQNPDQVKILIAADSEHADYFDEFGSLLTECWLEAEIDLEDSQIQVVDQPQDQATAAVDFLIEMEDVCTDQITIGVPDESVIPQLQRNLSALDVPCRSLPGKPLIETLPIRLLKACSQYLTTFSYDAYASLVRHPDVHDWICQKVGTMTWLANLTDFQNTNLPNQIFLETEVPFGDPETVQQSYDPSDASSKRRAEASAEAIRILNQVHCSIRELLGDLIGPKQPMSVWVERWQRLLVAIYGDLSVDRKQPADHQTENAIEWFVRALSNQNSVPPNLHSPTSSLQSLQLSLKEIVDLRVAPAGDAEAIELAGWLDLALDDAPVMVITGMNEGSVPTSERSHPFLPNELCKKLKILDNDRRYSRDCYALTVIRSVREKLLLIAGRRDTAGEPLKPSRLLFATEASVAAKRAKMFFQFSGNDTKNFWLADPQKAPPESRLAIPRPGDFQPQNQITVTRFRDYLKCPYRFYLKHVVRLETVRDDARELDAGQFGDLAHNCLEDFGRSDVRDSRQPAEIVAFLKDQLDRYTDDLCHDTGLPAVQIQLAQIRQRFEVFSKLQAQQRTEGWRIVSTEEMLEHEFDVDGEPFLIRGKIDRIDQHEGSGQIAIWDYKTSDKGGGPGTAHYRPKKREWIDLQLPLYRHLIKEVEVVADADLSNLTLGYVILSKRLEEIRFEFADWDDDLLAEADEVARSVLRCLRKSIFWPPTSEPPEYSEDFAAICQDHVFEPWSI